MNDMALTVEKLLANAEDCDLISKLATDPLKRTSFKRLADQLRLAADELKAAMEAKLQAGFAVIEDAIPSPHRMAPGPSAFCLWRRAPRRAPDI
jgi:hypothetical protein